MGKLENQKKTNFCQVSITRILFPSAICLGMRNGGNLSSFPARRVPALLGVSALARVLELQQGWAPALLPDCALGWRSPAGPADGHGRILALFWAWQWWKILQALWHAQNTHVNVHGQGCTRRPDRQPHGAEHCGAARQAMLWLWEW